MSWLLFMLGAFLTLLGGLMLLVWGRDPAVSVSASVPGQVASDPDTTARSAVAAAATGYLGGHRALETIPALPPSTGDLCHLWWEVADSLVAPKNPLSGVAPDEDGAMPLRWPDARARIPMQPHSVTERHFVAPAGHKSVALYEFGDDDSKVAYSDNMFPITVPCWLGEPSSVGSEPSSADSNSRRGLFMRTYTSRTTFSETVGASLGQLDYFVAFTYQQTAETMPSPQPTGNVRRNTPVVSLEFDEGAVVQVLANYKVNLKNGAACVANQPCSDKVIDEDNPIDDPTPTDDKAYERLVVRIRSSGFTKSVESSRPGDGHRTVGYRVPRMRPGYTRQVELRVDLLEKCTSASACDPQSYSPIVVDGVTYPPDEITTTGELSEYGIVGMVSHVSSGRAYRVFSLYSGFQRFPELHDARLPGAFWHNYYMRPAAVVPVSRFVAPFGAPEVSRSDATFVASHRALPPSDARVTYRQEYELVSTERLRSSATYDAGLVSCPAEVNLGIVRVLGPSRNASTGYAPTHTGQARFAVSFRSTRPAGSAAFAFDNTTGGIVSIFYHMSGPWASLDFPDTVDVSLWGGAPHPTVVTTVDSSAAFENLPPDHELEVVDGNNAVHFSASVENYQLVLTGRQHAYDASLIRRSHTIRLALTVDDRVVGRQDVRVRLTEYRDAREVGAVRVRHGSTAGVQRVLVESTDNDRVTLHLALPANWPDETVSATTAELEMDMDASFHGENNPRGDYADVLSPPPTGDVQFATSAGFGVPQTMQLKAATTAFAVAEPRVPRRNGQVSVRFRYVVRHDRVERRTDYVEVRWLGDGAFVAVPTVLPVGNLPLYSGAARYAGASRELRAGDAVSLAPTVHEALRDVMQFRFEPAVSVASGGPGAGGAGETAAQALSRIGLTAGADGAVTGRVTGNYHALWPVDLAVLPVFASGVSVVSSTGASVSSGEALHPVAVMRLHVVDRKPFTFGVSAGQLVATRESTVLLRPGHVSPGVELRVVATSELGGATAEVVVDAASGAPSVRLTGLPDGREVSLVVGWRAPAYPVLPPADAARLAHTETLVVRSVLGTALEATRVGEPEPGDALTSDGELVQFDLLPPSSGTPVPVPDDVVQVLAEYPAEIEFTLGVASQSVVPAVLLRSLHPDGTGTVETALEPAEHRSYVTFETNSPHLAVDADTGELRPADPARMVPLGNYAVAARLTAGPTGGAHVASVRVRSRGAFRYVDAGAPAAATEGAALKPRGPLFTAPGHVLQNFRVTGGELPPGVQLDQATGLLAGTPSLQGEYSAELSADAVDNGGSVFRDGFHAPSVRFSVQAARVTVVDAPDPEPTAPDPTDKATVATGGERGPRVNSVGYIGVGAMGCGMAASVASLFVGRGDAPK